MRLTNTTPDLDLFLFTSDPVMAAAAEAAGVDGVVIDWESKGKAARQLGYDTDTGGDSEADLHAVTSRLRRGRVLVRVDAAPELMPRHVEAALRGGATSLMLPVAETPDDVRRFLDVVAGRARTIVQIETQRLVDHCAQLNEMEWDTAYIGLNDLMISRGGRWIWEPFADGTISEIFAKLPGRRIGFGGVTVIGGGRPLPFTALLGEMARMGCAMSFLRRTFKTEIIGRDMPTEITAIRAVWRALRQRCPEAIERDHARFSELMLRTRVKAESRAIG